MLAAATKTGKKYWKIERWESCKWGNVNWCIKRGSRAQSLRASGSRSGMSGLAPKWVKICPKLDISGIFSDQISVHFGSPSQRLRDIRVDHIGNQNGTNLGRVKPVLWYMWCHRALKSPKLAPLAAILCPIWHPWSISSDGRFQSPAAPTAVVSSCMSDFESKLVPDSTSNEWGKIKARWTEKVIL